MNKLISTVEAVKCFFIQLILLIYSFKKRCFPSETGELLSCKFTRDKYGSHFELKNITFHAGDENLIL